MRVSIAPSSAAIARLVSPSAAEEIVLAGRRPAGGVGPLQGGEEFCQPGRELRHVVDALDRSGLAVEPAVDRPRPRIEIRRLALRQRRGDRKR
jgi:hypothetical protein